jgi:hypothetical protein
LNLREKSRKRSKVNNDKYGEEKGREDHRKNQNWFESKQNFSNLKNHTTNFE